MQGGAKLWGAWRDGRQIQALPADCRPRTIEEGYAAQDGLAASAGLAVAGYKIGATNPLVQARFGVDAPFSGRLFADFVGESPLFVPAGRVNFHTVEPEFDFVMGASLAPRAAPYTCEEVRAAVASVHPAIEMPDSRYADWLSMSAADLIADNAIGGPLCLGPAAEGGRAHDLAAQQVTVRRNGEPAAEGVRPQRPRRPLERPGLARQPTERARRDPWRRATSSPPAAPPTSSSAAPATP